VFTSSLLEKTLIMDFLSDTQRVNESLLLFNLPLLTFELFLHLLQLFGQELILFPKLLSGYSELLIFFLGID
jgi:hypothetical protein